VKAAGAETGPEMAPGVGPEMERPRLQYSDIPPGVSKHACRQFLPIVSPIGAVFEYIDLHGRRLAGGLALRRVLLGSMRPSMWHVDGSTCHHLRSIAGYIQVMGHPVTFRARFHAGTNRIPPIFAIWRRSGGPPKSMYSKIAGISETVADN